MKKFNIVLNGILNENPTFVMLIGMCPVIAITTSWFNAFGMGVCVLFVLIFSNLIISLLRNIVPNDIRIPVFIVVIATLVTIVELVLQAYIPDLYSELKIFVPLIVVNCIILGRAEAFASKNPPFDSVLDAIGMGVGFTVAMFIITATRILFGEICGLSLFLKPVGGFLTVGLLIGIIQSIRIKLSTPKQIVKEAK